MRWFKLFKIKKTYRLKKDVIKKIEQLAAEEGTSHANAIEIMVYEYFESKDEKLHSLLEAMSNLLDEKLNEMKEDLKRVRVTSNVIDRDTKMMLEFWNHYFVVNDFKELATTEKYKTEEFKEAEALIKKRIAHHRQRKLDWEGKRKKVNQQTKKEVK